ncbi:kinase-like domain-containing protein [Fimicolochytrium jonesii]|uniref:kinase-like domain-containing protein n=1 Tax=Fimicolochytrium jonesii TaxID=1396493 RepID=UPI0022FF0903|nr:kinase-like domain-containing protein [Fimicolochytrium jonesii]KAI8821807.1 kinase-like domain-containing protein [Fimicolochytrium jonesii]
MGNTQARPPPGAPVDLRHFELLQYIGKGAFGKVRVVKRKDTNKIYAMKYIDKVECVKMRAVHNIFRERRILEEIDHPFVVNLRYAFQDDSWLFMITDLMAGGDMRFHIDQRHGFPHESVRIMAAELVCALEYLHKRNIVHRDVKPDNILFDEKGHVHLTDFNIAVHYNRKNKLTSESGTLNYMAPEVFTKVGYSWPIDWWGLGIVIFEALYGRRPFRSGEDDNVVKDNICHQELEFPDRNLLDAKPVELPLEVEDFIRRLVERDVRKRIGCGIMGVEEIEAHPWFRGINWQTVEKLELQPVFVPDATRGNYDPLLDLEEMFADTEPLAYKSRQKKAPKAKSQDLAVVDADTPTAGKEVRDERCLTSPIEHSDENSPSAPNQPERTPEEIMQRELDYLDEHFKHFDYSVYESYRGFVDERTMSVSEQVPEWVKNLDEAGTSPVSIPAPLPERTSMASSILESPIGTPPAELSRMGSLVMKTVWEPPRAPPPPEEFVGNEGLFDPEKSTGDLSFPRASAAPKSAGPAVFDSTAPGCHGQQDYDLATMHKEARQSVATL